MTESMPLRWAQPFWDKAFDTISQMPARDRLIALAIIVIAFLAFIVLLSQKFGKPTQRNQRLFLAALACLLVLPISVLIASTFRETRSDYRIRIVVLGLNGQPAEALVTTPASGELKKTNGGWEFDTSPLTKSSDDKVTFYASAGDSTLIGTATLKLGSDYYPPQVTIQLHNAPSALACGTVTDEQGRPVVGARVSVLGEPDVTTTNAVGYFALPAHQISGEPITIRVEHAGRITEQTIIAGQGAEITVWKRSM